MKLLEATKFEDINHRPRPWKWRQDSATIVASFRSQATNMGGGYSFPVTICSLASHQKPVEFSPIWSLKFIKSKLNTQKKIVTDCHLKILRIENHYFGATEKGQGYHYLRNLILQIRQCCCSLSVLLKHISPKGSLPHLDPSRHIICRQKLLHRTTVLCINVKDIYLGQAGNTLPETYGLQLKIGRVPQAN